MAKKGLYEPQFWETNSGRGHWTRLFDDMVETPAFKSLTPEAKILYFFLKKEYKGAYNDTKDTVILPYTQAVDLTGIRKGNIRKHIDELERFGFISVKSNGGLYRSPNEYTFMKEWKYINDEEARAIKEQVRGAKRGKGRPPDGLP